MVMGHAGGLEGHADIVKVVPVEQFNVAEGGFHQGLGGDAAVFGQQRLLQGPAIDANSDGKSFHFTDIGHSLHPVLPSDVARVDAHRVAPGGHALKSQLVVKVDVHHQRDMDLLPDGAHRSGRRHVGHRHPDDLTARGLQPEDLLHRGFHVVGAGIAHGLDGHRRAAAHGHLAHHDLL